MRQAFAAHLGGATATEASVMPGYLALALAAVGIVAVVRGGTGRRRYAALTGACIVVGVLAGLPPSLPLGALTLPPPPLALHAFVPEIRTVARSAVLIQLGTALLAALGVAVLLRRATASWQRLGITAALLLGLRSLEPAAERPLDERFLQAGKSRWALIGVSADACTVAPGATLDVALLWSAEAPTAADQTVFVHLVGAAGALVAPADGPPLGGSAHSAALAPGAALRNVHTVQIPAALPAGAYRVQVGLYNAAMGARLPLASGGDTATLPLALQVVAGLPAAGQRGW